MTKFKEGSETESPFRIPKAKTLGLKINLPSIAMPHESLIKSEEKPKLEIVENIESLPSQSRQTRQTTHTRQTRQGSIAPTSNFQRVPNSITKDAIPGGLFKPGKSKHLYDILYSLTRGDITPSRSIRISKTKLMKKAGIGSRITFDSCVEHLSNVGLLKLTVFAGEHQGNDFEVFTPDEITTLPSQSSQSSQTSHAQNLDRLVILESRQTSQSSEAINIDGPAEPKTLSNTIKLKNDDDAPLAGFVETLNAAARKITGKDLTAKDFEQLSDLAELLVSETVIAAARTKSVSAFVPFALENFRRRLYSKSKGIKSKEESGPRWQDVGKAVPAPDDELIVKKLSEEQLTEVFDAYKTLIAGGNGEVLNELRMYGEIEYTPEDYAWLKEKLNF